MKNKKQISQPQRIDQIQAFLESQGLQGAPVIFLAGDASFRKYYRITLPENRFSQGPSTLLLMDAPAPENPQTFIQIAQFLKSYGFSAPRILAHDLTDGFVLLEDFGNQTYTACLTPKNTQEFYFLAIDTLIQLHQSVREKPPFIAPYTPEVHFKEALLLIEWYYEAAYGHPLDLQAAQTYKTLWFDILNKATRAPQSIVLRDFHVDNLMILADRAGTDRCGLLDFQDALWGSVTYDIVSLLEDARRDVPFDLIEKAWERYGAAFPNLDFQQLRTEGTILSAARHAKIIGIFTRLAVRDHKPHYLQHIPRTWGLLERCLTHPALGGLKQWFDVTFPERPIPHV